MADKTIIERLQPSLLDRLTDKEPEKDQESRDSRVIDIRQLRDIIRRDLSWLLNANNQDSQIDPEEYPNVTTSVLNYGVHEVSGDYSTEKRAAEIRKSIHKSISLFEPRIKQGTLEVSLHRDEKSSNAVFDFDIHADMWAQPLPMELYLRSQVDITTGHLTLKKGN